MPMSNEEKKKIVIIGSGFVGKATGKGFLSQGHDVTFVDINEILVSELKKEGMKACNIGAECAGDADIYLITVLTPTIDGQSDYRFIDSALASLGKSLQNNANFSIIVIRSTVLPGTTEGRFRNIIEKYSGKIAGRDFGLSMNPEFLRQISAEQDFMNPWMIVIGSNDPRVAGSIEKLYRPFRAPIVHMSIKEAEMMKYAHNIYNANKISFFNEMRMIAKKVGVDADKIFETVIKSAEGSWNHEYGIRDRGPFGGTCLPKDTRAFLSWANEKLGEKMPLLHAVIKVNEDVKDRQYLGY